MDTNPGRGPNPAEPRRFRIGPLIVLPALAVASGVFLLSRSKILRTTQTGDERPPAQAAAVAD